MNVKPFHAALSVCRLLVITHNTCLEKGCFLVHHMLLIPQNPDQAWNGSWCHGRFRGFLLSTIHWREREKERKRERGLRKIQKGRDEKWVHPFELKGWKDSAKTAQSALPLSLMWTVCVCACAAVCRCAPLCSCARVSVQRCVCVCAGAACCTAPKLKCERNVLEGDDKSEVNQSFPEGSGQMCRTQSLRNLLHVSV